MNEKMKKPKMLSPAELVEKYGGELNAKLRDPIFFINEIMGFDRPPYKLTPYQEEWIRLIEDNDRVSLMAFRSSGKTQALLVDYPLAKAYANPNWQGILVSNSLKQSTSIMRRVRERILNSDILRTSIPKTRDASWSKTEIQLTNGSMLWSRPNNENLPGEHVDFVGGDEIGYWKDMNIITKVIPPMTRAKNGKVLFIGTPTSDLDPIHELIKNKAYISKSYPADLKLEDGRTLWELRYPDIKMSDARKEYDSLSWSREFLCKPLSSGDQLFPYELISKAFNDDMAFSMIKDNLKSYYIGLDFALSGSAGADYTVYTVIAKTDTNVEIAKIERYKGLSYQAQKARIRDLTNTYKPIKVLADEGSFGKSFIQDLQSDAVPIVGFRFTSESKQQLITNLRNFFEQNRIVIPRDVEDGETITQTKVLIDELGKFAVIYDKGTVKLQGSGSHDDAVISLALACYAARGFGGDSYRIARSSSKRKSAGNIYMGRVN